MPAPAGSFGLGLLPAENAIEGGTLSQVFGQKGEAKGGMYKVTVKSEGETIAVDGFRIAVAEVKGVKIESVVVTKTPSDVGRDASLRSG